MKQISEIQVGNAITDAQRGWFVGRFIDEKLGLRHSDDVEIKWSVHPAGHERTDWVTSEARTTVCILISGDWEIIFPDKAVHMTKPGDFVMWGAGTDHKWRALADTTTISIRWPSAADY